MRVGIVGAGMCGLAAARVLRTAGHDVVIFEKNKRVGGRVSTFSQDGFVWDTGATSFAPRGKTIEHVLLNELPTEDLIRIEKPIYLHRGLRPTPGRTHGGPTRYTYRSGNITLPRMLSEGLELRLDTQVETIEREGSGFRVLGEPFDTLILTPPIPRASALLWSLQETRPLASVYYRACINVALGYDVLLPATNYHALLDPEQRHPLTWLTLESEKSPGRCPEGASALCAQLGPRFSLDNYTLPDEKLIETAAFFVSRIYGPAFEKPVSATVKRWKYSQPESFSTIEEANPSDTRLFIASDALLGGHTEDAYEVGVRVAERVQAL